MNNFTEVLGTVAMEPKGEYDSSTYYEKLNVVTYNDSTYMAIQPSNNVLPTDTDFWQLIGGGTTKESTILVFNTVALMKAATLKSGYTVKTLGYYAVNDGGGATYKITDTASLTEYQEEVGDLYATLISEIVTPEMFGAYGDGTHDDATALLNINLFRNVQFGKNKTYLTSKNIEISSGAHIDLNGSTLKMSGRLSESSGNIFYLSGNGIILENGKLIGDIDDRSTYPETMHGIRITGKNIEVKNMVISKFCADGITMTQCENINIHDLEVFNCGRNNISLLYGKNVSIHDIVTHDNERKSNPGHGIDIEPYADGQKVENLNMYNIYAYGNGGSGVNLSFYNNGLVSAKVHDITCEDNFSVKLSTSSNGKLYLTNITNIGNNFSIADACSEDFYIYAKNINIIEHTPSTTSSFWGSAFLIRSGATYSNDLYNIFIDGVNVYGGTSTYGVYVANAGSEIHNSFIKNVYCNRDTIPALIGSITKGLQVKNVVSNYIASQTGANMNMLGFANEINANVTGNNLTIQDNFVYNDYFRINNVSNDYLAITTQANNNYGTTTFRLPAGNSCLVKINKDNTADINADRLYIPVAANSTKAITLNNTTDIMLTRSTYREIFKRFNDELISIASSGSTGASVTISNGIATIVNSSAGNVSVYLDK